MDRDDPKTLIDDLDRDQWPQLLKIALDPRNQPKDPEAAQRLLRAAELLKKAGPLWESIDSLEDPESEEAYHRDADYGIAWAGIRREIG